MENLTVRIWRLSASLVMIGLLVAVHFSTAIAADAIGEDEKDVKLGLKLNHPSAQQGYTLFGPEFWTTTYLIDMDGRVVNTWESDYKPGHSVYLLENGNLLRTGQIDNPEFGFVPGHGGRIQEFTWDGELIWDFKYGDGRKLQHHDICRLPNGNVIMIAWEKKTPEEAIAAGRLPDSLGGRDLQVDSLIEVKPTGKTTGEFVWEWHLWDHVIQNLDPEKENYGDVAAHPELVDLNYGEDLLASLVATKDGRDKLRSLGYVGTPSNDKKPRRVSSDWTHTNGVEYNAELDQIVLSVHSFSEVWIIDHSTTTEEAAGHTGGRVGKGGDLLFRWGNPITYRAGTTADRQLFNQHNARWIPKGHPGEGNLLIFNNGGKRPGGAFSSIDEIELPVNSDGSYRHTPGKAYGPAAPVWSYTAPKKSDFYASFISGSHRLPNGNTFICSGPQGLFFEVTPQKETVWKYLNPVMAKPKGLGPGAPRPPRAGEILPAFLQGLLKLDDDQKSQLAELQKTTDAGIDQQLSDEQQKQWTDIKSGKGFGGGFPRPGQVMSRLLQARLKLTSEQKKQIQNVQSNVTEQLAKILSDEQDKQLKDMARGFPGLGRGPGPGGPPPGGGRGPGGPPPGVGGPPRNAAVQQFAGMPRGPGGVGNPGSGGPVFRATRYPANFPGLAGRDLKPGPTVEEMFAAAEKKNEKKNEEKNAKNEPEE